MALPVEPPIQPMLAKAISGVPDADGLVYEPKWDGFRCIVFRDGDNVELGSRTGKPLTRYFPELVEQLKTQLPDRIVLDGEIVIVTDHGLEFDSLQQRIHPAASRVKELSATMPASFIAFDVLALDDDDLREQPFGERRATLQMLLQKARPPIFVTPATTDRSEAERWFVQFEGAGLDGLIAKRVDLRYQENKRVMLKIKHERTADCVVAGFRWHKTGQIIGSLLLGLFDDEGVLHHVGITASFTMKRRAELVDEIAEYRMDDLKGHPWEAWAALDDDAEPTRRPGATSRWNAKKDLSWEPLRPELVCEVAYDHLQGDRFRHATTFRRWRTDRTPESCRYDQMEVVVPHDFQKIFDA